ncbi:MAG TPA: DUF4126 domain-containing protein [Longimicrobiaceae bacterium]|nr:DUF4126 domain-containing protein [Longimicrobiaceae bacterium]
MDALSAVAFGVVLAASAGLRAFLPAFAASLAARVFDLPLPEYLAWLERPEALLLFGVATLLEVLGDKVPLVDHALDSVQVFTKPALAALAATPFLYQLAPEHAVAVGIAVGAPLALGVHATKATVRVGSTAATGGLGNPFLSLMEDVVAFVAVAAAFLAPVVALLLMAALVLFLFRIARRVRRGGRRRAPA